MPAGRPPPYGWVNGAPGRGAQRGTEGTERRLEWRDRAIRQPVGRRHPGAGGAGARRRPRHRRGGGRPAGGQRRRRARRPELVAGGRPGDRRRLPAGRRHPDGPPGPAPARRAVPRRRRLRPARRGVHAVPRATSSAGSRRCAGTGWPTCRPGCGWWAAERWPPWSSSPCSRAPGEGTSASVAEWCSPRPASPSPPSTRTVGPALPSSLWWPSRPSSCWRCAGECGAVVRDDPLPAWLLAGGVVAVLGVLPSLFDGPAEWLTAPTSWPRCCSSPPSRSSWSVPSSRSCASPRRPGAGLAPVPGVGAAGRRHRRHLHGPRRRVGPHGRGQRANVAARRRHGGDRAAGRARPPAHPRAGRSPGLRLPRRHAVPRPPGDGPRELGRSGRRPAPGARHQPRPGDAPRLRGHRGRRPGPGGSGPRSTGPTSAEGGLGRRHELLLRHHDEVVGRLIVGWADAPSLRPRDEATLEELAAPLALAVSWVRLAADLRRSSLAVLSARGGAAPAPAGSPRRSRPGPHRHLPRPAHRHPPARAHRRRPSHDGPAVAPGRRSRHHRRRGQAHRARPATVGAGRARPGRRGRRVRPLDRRRRPAPRRAPRAGARAPGRGRGRRLPHRHRSADQRGAARPGRHLLVAHRCP